MGVPVGRGPLRPGFPLAPPGPPVRTAALLVALALAGCLAGDGPDARLPGVATDATITDELDCGALLFPSGCALVRFPEVHSGCDPEVPGYVVCNGTVAWQAESGSVVAGSRLLVSVNGTQAGSCAAPCSLAGNASFVHRFGSPGETHPWNVSVLARLDVPGDVPAAGGSFRLTASFVVRAEDRDSLSA
jgi:hypothetical protein